MGYHEQCIKCGGDMADGVDAGEMCRECLKAQLAEAQNKPIISRCIECGNTYYNVPAVKVMQEYVNRAVDAEAKLADAQAELYAIQTRENDLIHAKCKAEDEVERVKEERDKFIDLADDWMTKVNDAEAKLEDAQAEVERLDGVINSLLDEWGHVVVAKVSCPDLMNVKLGDIVHDLVHDVTHKGPKTAATLRAELNAAMKELGRVRSMYLDRADIDGSLKRERDAAEQRAKDAEAKLTDAQEALSKAFDAGAAYATGSHTDMKQTHPNKEEWIKSTLNDTGEEAEDE